MEGVAGVTAALSLTARPGPTAAPAAPGHAALPAASAVLRLVALAERRLRSESGALHIASRGFILVEHGRICWAWEQGMSGRLRELLAEHSEGRSRAELAGALRSATGNQHGLLSALVARGYLTEEALREVLRLHTAEALALLASEAADPRWVPSYRRRYDPPAVFSAAELLSPHSREPRTRESGEHPAAGAGMRHACGSFECVRPQDGGALRVVRSQGLEGAPAHRLLAAVAALERLDALGAALESRGSFIGSTASTSGGFVVCERRGRWLRAYLCPTTASRAVVLARLGAGG